MAFQFEGAPGATPQTRSNYERYEDEKDWNPKMDDVEVTSREVNTGTAMSRYDNRRPDPVVCLLTNSGDGSITDANI